MTQTRAELIAAAEALEWAGDPLSEAMGHQALILMIRERAEELRAQAAAAGDDWQHLKAYGYAPGGYMNKCVTCEQMVSDLDKRAIRCRPCAEKAFAAAGDGAQEPVAYAVAGLQCSVCGHRSTARFIAPPAQAERIALLEGLLTHALIAATQQDDYDLPSTLVERIRAALKEGS